MCVAPTYECYPDRVTNNLYSVLQDDEGAPLVYEDGNNATVLVGITSFLGTGPWPCGSGMPAGNDINIYVTLNSLRNTLCVPDKIN